MRQYTQSSLEPGNCWQTSIACLLEVDPSELPPQIEYDLFEIAGDGTKHYTTPSYMSVLQRYLRVHHNLAYVEIHYPEEILTKLCARGPHMLTGYTERSAHNGNQRHVIVGANGVPVWDPHPSRAGLSHGIQWAFLIPFPEVWRPSPMHQEPCVCPSCIKQRHPAAPSPP